MTGFFRTGSTFVFSALRADSRFRCYYEPYHPMMEKYLTSGNEDRYAADASFLRHTMDGDYFAEYRSLDKQKLLTHLNVNARPSIHPVLGENSVGNDLKGYIDFLIATAIGEGKIPILQCNRWNMVLPWLKARYPDFVIVLITRSSVSVALSLYGLARKEGRHLDVLSPLADHWDVALAARNIAVYYGFDCDSVGQLNYLQKVHFIIQFAELYMSRYCDITLNYDRFGLESMSFFDTIGKSLGFNLQSSKEYFAKHWRQESDKSKVVEEIGVYFERPEEILRTWVKERSNGI